MFVGVDIVKVMEGNGNAEFVLLAFYKLFWFGQGVEDEELRFAFLVRADECVNDNESEEFFGPGLGIVTVEDESIDVEFVVFFRELDFTYDGDEVFGWCEYWSGIVDIAGEVAAVGVEYCLTGVLVIEHFAEAFPCIAERSDGEDGVGEGRF